MPTLHGNTDEVLMDLIARHRNAQAFGVLYDRWSARMYRYFLRLNGRNHAKAADLSQDLFLKVIEKAYLFDTSKVFSTWIYAIASNMCKNEYRRKKLLQQVADYPEMIGENGADSFPGNLDRASMEIELQLAINRLEDPHRQCFVLRWQEGLSVRDISEIMECPEGTVKSRLHYALQQVAGYVKTTDWL
jgi:RNA polymerase sigma-70 factor, ECF subfamily